jgi:hypothetical protein
LMVMLLEKEYARGLALVYKIEHKTSGKFRILMQKGKLSC